MDWLYILNQTMWDQDHRRKYLSIICGSTNPIRNITHGPVLEMEANPTKRVSLESCVQASQARKYNDWNEIM